MCCERLQISTIEKAVELRNNAHPAGDKLLEIVRKVCASCPAEVQTHTSKQAGIPLPSESVAIPAFFRNNPEDTDLLEILGALEPLLAGQAAS